MTLVLSNLPHDTRAGRSPPSSHRRHHRRRCLCVRGGRAVRIELRRIEKYQAALTAGATTGLRERPSCDRIGVMQVDNRLLEMRMLTLLDQSAAVCKSRHNKLKSSLVEYL
jgi:hypothetical protein